MVTADVFATVGSLRKQAFWLRKAVSMVFPHKQSEEKNRQEIISAQKCLSRICQAYGIAEFGSKNETLPSLVDDWETEADIFGWAAVQANVLFDCIEISENLNGSYKSLIVDYDAMVHYATYLLRHQYRQLTKENQEKIMGLVQRVVQESATTVDTIWWRDSLLRSIEIQRFFYLTNS